MSTAAAAGDHAVVDIELVLADRVATVVLDDSVAARGLSDRLPLTLDLRDSFGLAMVATVPAGLDTGGAPVSCSFPVGEIVYSPTDQAIAIVHSPDAARLETPGVVRLGVVTSGLSALTGPGTVRVTVRSAG